MIKPLDGGTAVGLEEELDIGIGNAKGYITIDVDRYLRALVGTGINRLRPPHPFPGHVADSDKRLILYRKST